VAVKFNAIWLGLSTRSPSAETARTGWSDRFGAVDIIFAPPGNGCLAGDETGVPFQSGGMGKMPDSEGNMPKSALKNQMEFDR
jgi:hypothetical protein